MIRRRSPEANQTLHDVSPSPALAHCIYTFGALALWLSFARCKVHFTPKSRFLLYWLRYCTALQQRASAKLCGVIQGMELRNFHIGRHLCLAGRPSRWAPAHILVWCIFSGILWPGQTTLTAWSCQLLLSQTLLNLVLGWALWTSVLNRMAWFNIVFSHNNLNCI